MVSNYATNTGSTSYNVASNIPESPPILGEYPIAGSPTPCYIRAMNLLVLIVVLLLLFGGGGFYFGGPAIGGGGVGLILLVCLIIFLMGGFRARS
jgi:hypothetical protein